MDFGRGLGSFIRMKRLVSALAIAAVATAALAAPKSRLGEIKDEDTKAWWALTEQLSGDDMEGRDTGSAGYRRAAEIVAKRMADAGLTPAGDNGTWLQAVPLHEVRVEKAGTSFTIEREPEADQPKRGLFGSAVSLAGGIGGPKRVETLAFLHEISVRANDTLPAEIDGQLVFRGYCEKGALGDVKGKVVVCFDTRRAGMVTGAERVQAASDAGAVGIVQVDDPLFTIEPARWPDAYARTLTFRGQPISGPKAFAIMRLSDEGFTRMIAGAGRDARKILDDGGHQKGLETFDIPARLRATFAITQRDLESPNVLGLLPGSDPALKAEVVALSAHLDGYGFGEAVRGDALYNGALDDAAYVALLIREADRLKASGKPPRRSILFCVFTGEEKGLLGAAWFTRHTTVPKASLAADINLDQLRPLFPLKILTMHAVNDSTLGDDVKAVAGPMGIEIRPDREPERNLLRRADHWPFIQIGVPATGFVFGYDPGTDAERRYREWYQVRYHRPQDDIGQPIDFGAAKTFDDFFYALVDRVADADARPAWKPDSPFRPK
jgi:hypothetical protein